VSTVVVVSWFGVFALWLLSEGFNMVSVDISVILYAQR
jgi:bacteriorhodopsin